MKKEKSLLVAITVTTCFLGLDVGCHAETEPSEAIATTHSAASATGSFSGLSAQNIATLKQQPINRIAGNGSFSAWSNGDTKMPVWGIMSAAEDGDQALGGIDLTTKAFIYADDAVAPGTLARDPNPASCRRTRQEQ